MGRRQRHGARLHGARLHGARRDGSIWPWSASMLLVLLACRFDLLIGRSTFFFRDLQTTHVPALVAFESIGFARTNPYASFGQSYLGNPNLLVAYPFFKSASLVSLHVIVHLVLCLLGMVAFQRRLEMSADAAWFGALAFTCSGYVLSASSSLNAVTTIAWIPWVLWTAETARRGPADLRRLGTTFIVATLFLLAGEPVLIGITLLFAVGLLCPWRRQNIAGTLRWTAAFTAGAILTAFDELDRPVERERRLAAMAVLGALSIGLVMAAASAAWAGSALLRGLATLWWNRSWIAAPELVLSPIVSAIPGQLLAGSLIVGIAAWAVARGGGAAGKVALHAMVIAEGLLLAQSLLPTTPTSVYEQESYLVRAASSLRGRVFERAAKDLDPVIHGIRGVYRSNDVRLLADAQARQGWALSGVRHGIRYAFDSSPDGSYTDRDQAVHDTIDGSAWPLRLKWLRAGGVVAMISSEHPKEVPGATFRAIENTVGVPTRLYSLTSPLPEVRRVSNAVMARSTADALNVFASPSFDEATTIVVEGGPSLRGTDPAGLVLVRQETPDLIEIETSGDTAAYLFVARSYTARQHARTADGRSLTVVPADVTWTAVLVPAGRVRVRLFT